MNYLFQAVALVIFTSELFAAPGVGISNGRDLKEPVKRELGLRDVSIQEIDFPDRTMEAFNFIININENLLQIVFHRHSNRSPAYRVLVQKEDGTLREKTPGPVETYRGAVLGVVEAFSAASFVGESFKGFVQLEEDRWWFESIEGRIKGASSNAFAVYSSSDVISPEGFCGTLDEIMHPHEGHGSEGRSIGGQRSIQYAEMICDSDYEYFQTQGSESNVENEINAILNGVNALYEEQLEISHYITDIVVRPTSNDPYSGSIYNRLDQLTSQWSSHPTDVAHMFSGSSGTDSTIGVAWLGGICSSNGAGVVLDCCNSFACLTDLSAHELGHNWSAGHIDDGNTMNSSLACANNFSSGSINTITNFRNSISSCLDENLECTNEGGSLAYDHCSGALIVSSGATSFNTSSASQSCDGFTDVFICPTTNLGDLFSDVWFAWEPVVEGEATASTCGSASFDTDIVIYRSEIGSCESKTEIACNGDAANCPSGRSRVSFDAAPGNLYFIRVGGSLPSESGGAQLLIEEANPEGACCLPQACYQTDALSCASFGGELVVGGTCNSGACDPAPGACCVGSNCYQFSEDECAILSGTFGGEGTSCATDTCGVPCPADFNGDQLVNVLDLLELVAAFGTPDGDINGDNNTNTLDLLEVVSAFGSCD